MYAAYTKGTVIQNCLYRAGPGFFCRDPDLIFTVPADNVAHDDVTKWKNFPRYWPFVRGIHRSPVNSPHKGQWRGALMFSLICAWINVWVNNREAGDMRRHRAHYDVIDITVLSTRQAHCWLQNRQDLVNMFSGSQRFRLAMVIAAYFNGACRNWISKQESKFISSCGKFRIFFPTQFKTTVSLFT